MAPWWPNLIQSRPMWPVPTGFRYPTQAAPGCVVVFAAAVLFIVAGNLLILAAFVGVRIFTTKPALALDGVDHLRPVTSDMWRGNAPTATGYAALAEHGVTTVIDLRAERDLLVDADLLDRLGIARVHIPIRDGQAPAPQQVGSFLSAVEQAPGRVYVHCGAGVGRTGAMTAVWLVNRERATPLQALRRNLSVGPPSLEQIVFVLSLDQESVATVPAPATWLSRLWDAPRRVYTTYLRQIWS